MNKQYLVINDDAIRQKLNASERSKDICNILYQKYIESGFPQLGNNDDLQLFLQSCKNGTIPTFCKNIIARNTPPPSGINWAKWLELVDLPGNPENIDQTARRLRREINRSLFKNVKLNAGQVVLCGNYIDFIKRQYTFELTTDEADFIKRLKALASIMVELGEKERLITTLNPAFSNRQLASFIIFSNDYPEGYKINKFEAISYRRTLIS